MANKIKFKLNKAGIIELFTSPQVNAWLQQVGDSVADRAESMASVPGAEYGARAHNAGRTAIVNIFPANKEAAHDNYENNTLLKAKSEYPSTKPKL